MGCLNADLDTRMGGSSPLQYVDIEDAELANFPALAEAVAEGKQAPLVLVGEEVKSPEVISIFWIEDQLASLGVEPFLNDGGGRA